MEKKRVFIIVGAVLLGGILAGFLDYPKYLNHGIEFFNNGKNKISFLQKLPSLPSFPERPFQLGLDLQGGIHLVYEADLSQVETGDYDSAMEGLRDVMERRVNLFGVREPIIQTEGSGSSRRLIIELAGIRDPNEAIELIGKTPYLEFREQKPNFDEIVQKNQKVLETGEGVPEDPFAPTSLTGRYLKRVELGFDDRTKEPIINLQFNDEGAKIFEELTERNVGKPLAIYLDFQLLSAPIVQSKISGGRAQITGNFTREEARAMVRNMNAGALPIPVNLISQQNVGPVLGKVSLEQSLKAGIVGFVLVIAFMIFFYRVPGFFAAIALLLYVLFLLALFKLIPVTLTLAGIAGFILSIGMAVDANILIFSRMREELREGKSFSVALQEGFRRAWPSIRDGNLTTLLVAFILFWFGSSFVQGFALTLSLGIVMSMFSAIFVTKNFLSLFVHTRLERVRFLWS